MLLWIVVAGAILLGAALLAPKLPAIFFTFYMAAAFNGWIAPPFDRRGSPNPFHARCIQPIVASSHSLVVAEVYVGNALTDITIGDEDLNHTLVQWT